MHGNADAQFTYTNAVRCLYAFGGSTKHIPICQGAKKPLIKLARHDAEIHGVDGLGGVEGLPGIEHAEIRRLMEVNYGNRAVERMAEAVRDVKGGKYNEGGGNGTDKLVVVSTGPMTNIALFLSVYPDLMGGVEELVFMGGAVGVGNRSAVAGTSHLCFGIVLTRELDRIQHHLRS